MGWLEGCSAVVTGAGSGLGAALVRRFVAEGAGVVAVDKSADKLSLLRKEVGDNVEPVTGDVTSYADNAAACQIAIDRFGKLDTFVGNAGLWDFNSSLAATAPEVLERGFDELFAVNVKGYLLGAKAAHAHLARSRGSIILTLSNAALFPAGGGPLYVASKHAGVGLVRQLAYELAPDVRVNAVAPGGMASDLRGPGSMGLAQTAITDAFPINEVMVQFSPLHRANQAAEYAGAYVLLAAGRESATVTGSVVDVSSFGIPARPPSDA